MRALLFALIATTTTFGCGSKSDSTATKNEDVAKQDVAKATDKVTDVAARVGHEADDKATEAVQVANNVKVDVNNATASAATELSKARDAMRDKLQQGFDATDRKYVALKERIAKASTANRSRVDAAAADVKTREAAVMAGIAKLRTTTAADWDATKVQLDADAAALDKAVDNLDAALK